MKILNRGKKDYYDYLAGIYGIDNDIVYDRREFIVLNQTTYSISIDIGFFFDKTIFRIYNNCLGDLSDSPRVPHGYSKTIYGRKHSFILEIGFYQYLFEVERYISDDGRLIIEPKLVEKFDNGKHFGNTPITLFLYKDKPLCSTGIFIDSWDSIRKELESKKRKSEYYENPILSDTWITGFISAEEVYNNVYNYLIANREPDIQDNRNDIQKLESKGFDKKTSFRHPINKTDNPINKRRK